MNTQKNIEVNAFYFTRGRQFKSYPARITIEDQQYTFKSGLQLLIQKGQHIVRLFQMSDGHHTYKLKQEDGQWTFMGLGPAV
jgi:hypothetical protein